MFSVLEYLTAIHASKGSPVGYDEVAVSADLARVLDACETWGRTLRIRDILFRLGLSL